MGAACKSGEGRWRATSVDAPTRSFAGQFGAGRRFAREGRFAPDPQSADRRRINRASDWSAPLDERDIDRELAVAGEKFARAIERVHQQEPLGDLSPPSGSDRFLGAYRQLRGYARQVFTDDDFGPMIR